jgi:hypothetical protein
MLIRRGGHTDFEARVEADPADDSVANDYYTRSPQIRLTADPHGASVPPAAAIEVTLDGNDVARLVECALRHPGANMRYAVLAAIWCHADSFRQIFRFGLNAPDGFAEVRAIVAEEIEKRSATVPSTASLVVKPAGETLLPRMPLPAHLRHPRRR